LIEAEKANYPILWMCRLLGVPRSTFYAWRARTETPTAARRRELSVHVTRVFDRGRGAYGCRRVAAHLNREGYECSVGLVAELMRELGLRAIQPRAYKRTTIPGPARSATPDLIGRDFTAAAPATRLVGDITYLKTGEGWLYLATVIDLATRMVVGWQLADHMRTSLIVDALTMAIEAGHVEGDAIFHSDRGAQGEFQWSSQHLYRGGVRGVTCKVVEAGSERAGGWWPSTVGGRSGVAAGDAFARSTGAFACG
jgi:putative transposase